MAYNMGGRRFRPVGSGKKRTAPQYGPVGTGCPFVEEAVARLYREQNEEHFWSLMNALNYALELQTKVLVPLDAAVDPQSGAAPWAHLPIPEERAEGLQPWLLHTRKERNYLPLFTSVKNAEAEKASATRPMVERSLRSAMEYALETDGIDGVVLDPWTSSATLDVSLLSGLLRSERGSDNPGAQELEAGHAAARAGDWQEAAARYTAAAEAGSAEALSALGDCLYYGRGARKNKTQARRMWKKAAQAGEVQAMIALGDDCAASGGEMAETLQYYRRAQSAAREVPDIAYTPQVCLRLAQYETQYLSRKKALLQVAEAVQGFRILQAEGEKASKILVAEGEKQSAILKADAAKQARIMAAEAEATSIMKVQQALADAMRMLNENAPNDQVIKLKSLEALQKMADGKATKIIIPSEIQGLAGLAASAKTLLESDPPQE